MFTRAGFRQPARIMCRAMVSRGRWGMAVPAALCRWAGGELAWASATQVCWPEHVHVRNHYSLTANLPASFAYFRYSDIRTRNVLGAYKNWEDQFPPERSRL